MSLKPNNTLSGTPMAYFITISTYGTRLPGDDRGWVCRNTGRGKRSEQREPSVTLRDQQRAVQKHPLIMLDSQMRACVRSAFHEASEQAGWALLACAVQTNHLHALVASGASAGQTLSRLKGAATRNLRRMALVHPNQPVWTRQGSTRYLWTERSVSQVTFYIESMQDDMTAVMPWAAWD